MSVISKNSIILVSMIFMAACGTKTRVIEPPEIHYGQDLCDSCGMVIDDARFSAAIILSDGRSFKFDDLGEMMSYENQHAELSIAARYVHDYYRESWINAETAFFVRGSMIKSPMGKGIVAFEDVSTAKQYIADVGGELLIWEELILAQAQARG